jgi:dTDP-4-amino-4,6-dideoxygalactose transaminase
MVTTNDDGIADLVGMLRNHGASISEEQRHHGPQPYILPDFNLLGYNYRMTDIQAAVGVVQIKKLDQFINEREFWALWYTEQLASLHWLRTPHVDDNYKHGWQSYVTFVDPDTAPYSRNEIMQQLQARGISTRPGTHAVHMLNYYRQQFGLTPEDYPGAKSANDNSMAIPLHNRMTSDDYQYVVDALASL